MPVVDDSATRRRQLVGANIKLRRRQIGMGQRELARLLHMDQTHLSQWETARHEPSARNIERLAAVLNVPSWWFYAPHEEPWAS